MMRSTLQRMTVFLRHLSELPEMPQSTLDAAEALDACIVDALNGRSNLELIELARQLQTAVESALLDLASLEFNAAEDQALNALLLALDDFLKPRS